MIGEKKIPAGLDRETASFILDEHERRRHDERKALLVKPKSIRDKVVTMEDVENMKKQAAEGKKRESLIKRYKRLKKEIAELEKERQK